MSTRSWRVSVKVEGAAMLEFDDCESLARLVRLHWYRRWFSIHSGRIQNLLVLGDGVDK